VTDTPVQENVRWVIAVAGREEQIVVEAATVQNHASTGSVHSPGSVALTTLLDAGGEIVFQAPTLSVVYLRRFGPPEHIIK